MMIQHHEHIFAWRSWVKYLAEEINKPADYRALGSHVLAFRKMARHCIGELSLMARRGYGNAVLSAIRAKQAGALRRAAVPIGRPNNASGTFEQTGEAILKAVASQNRAKAVSADKNFSQSRADAEYAKAMKAKHGAVEFKQAA